jgi:IS5 family transposase
LWDEVLPVEVRELPEDLARLDGLLRDRELLRAIERHWRREAETWGRSAAAHGGPSIAMETYVRLIMVKWRTGWGYETLVREVSDSLHLRRFWLIGIDQRVPEESTIRKLTRRLGPEVVAELTRAVIEKAVRERRFRPRAARVDSTVVEADVLPDGRRAGVAGGASAGFPGSPAGATGRRDAGGGARSLARGWATSQGDRPHARRAHRPDQGAGDGAQGAGRSAREAKRLAATARRKARGRGARAKLCAAAKLEGLAGRCERVAEQIAMRLRGEKITDRLVSIADPEGVTLSV